MASLKMENVFIDQIDRAGIKQRMLQATVSRENILHGENIYKGNKQ